MSMPVKEDVIVLEMFDDTKYGYMESYTCYHRDYCCYIHTVYIEVH